MVQYIQINTDKCISKCVCDREECLGRNCGKSKAFISLYGVASGEISDLLRKR